MATGALDQLPINPLIDYDEKCFSTLLHCLVRVGIETTYVDPVRLCVREKDDVEEDDLIDALQEGFEECGFDLDADDLTDDSDEVVVLRNAWQLIKDVKLSGRIPIFDTRDVKVLRFEHANTKNIKANWAHYPGPFCYDWPVGPVFTLYDLMECMLRIKKIKYCWAMEDLGSIRFIRDTERKTIVVVVTFDG